MINVLKVLEVINLEEKLLYLYFCAQKFISPLLQFCMILGFLRLKAGFQRQAPHGFHWSGDLVELEKPLDEKE